MGIELIPIEQLPARAKSTAVARALRSEHREPYDVPAKARYKAQEVVRFVAEMWSLMQQGHTRRTAAQLVRTRQEHRFPILSKAGKKGANALTETNYSNWARKLGRSRHGKPDTTNWRAVLDNYDRGARGRKGAEDWWTLFYQCHLSTNQQHLTMAYRDACKAWKIAGMREAPPTLAHVKYWDKRYGDKYVQMLAVNGPTWFKNHVMGFLPRDWSDVRPNEIWVGDHRKTDNFIRHFDEAKGKWVPMRIWVTAWRDAKSGHFVGSLCYPGGESPNAATIIECLIKAIRDTGYEPPKALYIDNGKDFVAQGFTKPVVIDGNEMSICLALGIDVIIAIKFNAQAKPVENSFKTLVPYYDKRMPGYVGSNLGSRPEDAWKRARENLDMLPSLQQATELFAEAVREHEQRVTRSMIQQGISTVELWESRTPLREPVTPKDLHMATLRPLPASQMRTIRRGADGPSLQHEGWWYSSPKLIEYGRHHLGDKVVVYLDACARTITRNGKQVPGYIYFGTADGRILGRCDAADTYAAWSRTEEERAKLAEGMAERRRLLKDTRDRMRGQIGRMRPVSTLQATAEFLLDQGALPELPAPADTQQLPPADSAGFPDEPAASMTVSVTAGSDLPAESASFSDEDAAYLAEVEAMLLAGGDSDWDDGGDEW